MHGVELVRPEEAQLVVPDESASLVLVLVCRFRLVVRSLGEYDEVGTDRFVGQTLGIGYVFLVVPHRVLGGK